MMEGYKENIKNKVWALISAQNEFSFKRLMKKTNLRSCFEFLQKVFLGLMYPFSCVLWAIFWSFPLLFFVR